MAFLLHQLIDDAAQRTPDAAALLLRDQVLNYGALSSAIGKAAGGLVNLGLAPDDRVAVYLPKRFETVIALFAAAMAGGVFIPINPLLKPEQVRHILSDSGARFLITTADRAALLDDALTAGSDLDHLILVDSPGTATNGPAVTAWTALAAATERPTTIRIDTDMAAILYTSGSTGRPKGVVLSHRNLVAGAQSVADYLHNTAADRLLAALPLSFDYGLSQITTAFLVGASVVLLDYLLPRDVVRAVARYAVTGLAAVPPLWNQLAALRWPDEAVASLRYITNSGGGMPVETTRRLRETLTETDIFLMYGLTEAFRSTYLSPDLVAQRPESIGKAIPNAQIMIVRPDGSACGVGEPGELVHRGALVALGYWGDPSLTGMRFRPAPDQPKGRPDTERAVWSGDQVKRDADGFLYFIGRDDDMIKTSGYRVSPAEIEEVAYRLAGICQAAAFGVTHPMLGQAIVLLTEAAGDGLTEEVIRAHCQRHLPSFMVPAEIRIASDLPRNPNGKVDRALLSKQLWNVFLAESEET